MTKKPKDYWKKKNEELDRKIFEALDIIYEEVKAEHQWWIDINHRLSKLEQVVLQ